MESRAREGLWKGASLNTPRLWMILFLALGVLGALAFGFSGGKATPPVPPVPLQKAKAAPRPPSRPLQTGLAAAAPAPAPVKLPPAPKLSETKPLQGLAVSYPNEPLPVDLERRLLLPLLVYESVVNPTRDPKVLRCGWEEPKPRFARQEDRGLRTGRILCLADPDRAANLLKRWALDRSLKPIQRQFAIALLGEMASAAYPGGPQALHDVALREDDLGTRDLALLFLYSQDHEGIAKPLYRERFAQGEGSWSSQALVLWADPEHVAAVRNLKHSEKEFSTATIMTRYLEVLQAPDRNERLIRMISEIPSDPWKWMPWALKAGLANHVPGIKEALRVRLDLNETLAIRARNLRIKDDLPIVNATLDSQYVFSSGWDALFDFFHDESLLAYWRLGGELTEREKQRLNYHGFLGDQTENMKGIR